MKSPVLFYKIISVAIILAMLTSCKFVEESNQIAITKASKDCASRGFDRVSVTYMFGMASAYYTCFNSSATRLL